MLLHVRGVDTHDRCLIRRHSCTTGGEPPYVRSHLPTAVDRRSPPMDARGVTSQTGSRNAVLLNNVKTHTLSVRCNDVLSCDFSVARILRRSGSELQYPLRPPVRPPPRFCLPDRRLSCGDRLPERLRLLRRIRTAACFGRPPRTAPRSPGTFRARCRLTRYLRFFG